MPEDGGAVQQFSRRSRFWAAPNDRTADLWCQGSAIPASRAISLFSTETCGWCLIAEESRFSNQVESRLCLYIQFTGTF